MTARTLPDGIESNGGGSSPAEFAAFLRADLDKWAGVITASGAKGS